MEPYMNTERRADNKSHLSDETRWPIRNPEGCIDTKSQSPTRKNTGFTNGTIRMDTDGTENPYPLTCIQYHSTSRRPIWNRNDIATNENTP